MKIVLSNATSGKMCTVYPRGEPVQFFNRKAYKISYKVFTRIVKTLCPKPTDDLFGINHKDANYRVIKWDYNFRGHGDASEYYIEILNNEEI
jgi:hypothetical protein